ncbi:recombinase family protein [Butyrivibrio sp. CB08]|uniref:recombinase family protein n=1 Tax=Butyrivibrio sp. CB08 TaxID=2364879 RepID=UPI000EA9C9C2|nr:recombinase family protein [Butyrivibrio sp. CB08]RKM55397.1 recombinase family protein [Butyrivibrio sp. CB08]
MPRIIQLQKKVPAIQKRLRVAAYARVSEDGERLLHSLSNQVSYYSELIQKNPAWEFVGVYADEAITGTLIRKRDEFNRLIKDCEEGKIDIILTKSIQRFARNTVDLLQTVRHLKDLGVEVRFEEQNINTMSGDGELLMTITGAFAQEEVRSLSDNVRWARKRRIDNGEAPIRMQVTGYRWEGEELVEEPEEADIIRRIYREYLDGKSPGQICKGLKADGIKTIRGHWFQEGPVYKILRNPLYKGDLILQKTFIEDPITKVQRWNTGELPKVIVEENHEPIIEPAMWDAVQSEMKRRKADWDSRVFEFEGRKTFTFIIKCGQTGMSLRHQPQGSVAYGNDGSWSCERRDCPYKGKCGIKPVPDLALKQACKRALDMDEFDESIVREKVQVIEIPKDGRITIKKKDGTVYEDYFRGLKDSVEKQPINRNCFSKKLICGCCGEYFGTICLNQNGIRRVTWNCKVNADNSFIHENVLKFRVAEVAGWDEFSFDKFREEVDHIDMDRPCHMIIHFKDGRAKGVEYYSQKQEAWRGRHGKKDNKDTRN